MKKVLGIIIESFSWVLIVFFVITLVMTLLSNFNLLRSYRSFLVQSGSMEPSIMIGDVVITNKAKQYHQGDVVTFSDEDGRTVTHRIIEVKETGNNPVFATKGDANRSKDRNEITFDQILGKATLVIPKLGFVIVFSRTVPGMIILVFIPAGIILFDEIKSLFKATSKRKIVKGGEDTSNEKKELKSE